MPTWATIMPLGDDIVPLGQYLLDAGEAAVIQLAIERGVKDVRINEWRGRRAAAAVGLGWPPSDGIARAAWSSQGFAANRRAGSHFFAC